jgi:proteasome activator subunit 4
VQPLVDWVVSQFQSTDLNGQSTFDATKVLIFFRAFYEEVGWKAAAWMDEAIQRVWPELVGEHDDVSRLLISRQRGP